MPKAKQKSNTRDRDSDDEYISSQAPASQALSQAQKTIASMDRGEKEKRLNDLVQYLLVMDQKKIPIKKQDINKHVLKEFSKAFPVMIKLAADKLRNVFGIELVPLDDKLKGSYILVNKIDVDTDDQEQAGGFNPVEWSDEDNASTGLLMVILSLVFMNGKVMQDSQLWHVLKKLGVDQDCQHEFFGDVKKLVSTEFVRQGYLEFTRQPNSDPPVFDVRWGQRAQKELPLRYCLQFVSQLYEKEPEVWTSQWQMVMEQEGMTNGASGSGS